MVASRYHQNIPRPEIAGDPTAPPWSTTRGDAPELSAATLRSIAQVLEPPSSVPDDVNAAVLVPLVWRPSGFVVVLTRRAATLEREPGTVAFPGGRREPGEAPLETALRETEEEIGLHRSVIELLGSLPAVEQRHGARVAVYVGLVAIDAELAPNAAEVDVVLEPSLGALYRSGVAWEEIWGAPGEARRVRFFANEDLLGRDVVWGMSAGILWELLVRLDGVLG